MKIVANGGEYNFGDLKGGDVFKLHNKYKIPYFCMKLSCVVDPLLKTNYVILNDGTPGLEVIPDDRKVNKVDCELVIK